MNGAGENGKTIHEKLAEFGRYCRSAGLRLTYQRQEIYRELAEFPDHPSAETLYQRLRSRIPTLSLDTVYRTLATFAERGLINKVETVENQARFEAAIGRHHHLMCTKCKEIIDFDWPVVDEATLPADLKSWGRIDTRSAVLYGICSKCMK
jgi:Fur family peroxide stress response transcriptional regulator